MSRSVRGSKGSGYEYWGKRALSMVDPGRYTKKLTASIERQQSRKLVIDELQLLGDEDDQSDTPCAPQIQGTFSATVQP